MLKLKCHLVDSLPQIGGQLSEIYPKKPIYDIPGYPSVLAGELVNNLMEQIKPFNTEFFYNERVDEVKQDKDNWIVKTNNKNNFCPYNFKYKKTLFKICF